MKYKIKYHDISGDWLIFDMGDSFELIGIHSSEQDAKQHAEQLQEAFEKRARCSRSSLILTL
jgi:hypothetical protein